MQYFLMYMWKLTYWISGIVIVVGIFIMGMDISKIFIANKFLQLIVAIVMWIGGSFIVFKPLSMLDKLLENKVTLDKDARLNFNVFVTFALISLAVFFASIYTFNMWLERINNINRTLDDYFMIIFPLVLLVSSIGSLIGSFNLYKKYKNTIKRKEK